MSDGLAALNAILDVVLAYRPRPKPTKRGKPKRRTARRK
jgi:hypothetical protein